MHLRVTLLACARSSSVLDVRFDDDRRIDDTGRRELQQTAPLLRHLAAAELRYCSPSLRCRETGDLLGLAPLPQPALRDCDMGRWRGYTLQEVTRYDSRAVDAWLTEPRAAPHGGESLLAFIRRIGGWLDTRPADGGGRIVAVTEPSVLRAAVCYALRAAPHAYWNIDPAPLGAVSLHGSPGRWQVALER